MGEPLESLAQQIGNCWIKLAEVEIGMYGHLLRWLMLCGMLASRGCAVGDPVMSHTLLALKSPAIHALPDSASLWHRLSAQFLPACIPYLYREWFLVPDSVTLSTEMSASDFWNWSSDSMEGFWNSQDHSLCSLFALVFAPSLCLSISKQSHIYRINTWERVLFSAIPLAKLLLFFHPWPFILIWESLIQWLCRLMSSTPNSVESASILHRFYTRIIKLGWCWNPCLFHAYGNVIWLSWLHSVQKVQSFWLKERECWR